MDELGREPIYSTNTMKITLCFFHRILNFFVFYIVLILASFYSKNLCCDLLHKNKILPTLNTSSLRKFLLLSAKISWSTNIKFALANELLGYNNFLLADKKFQSLAKVRWACISLDAFNIHMSDADFFSYLPHDTVRRSSVTGLVQKWRKWNGNSDFPFFF